MSHRLDPELSQLLHSGLSLGTVSDIIAHALDLPAEIKQALLDETQVDHRVATLTTVLKELVEQVAGIPAIPAAVQRQLTRTAGGLIFAIECLQYRRFRKSRIRLRLTKRLAQPADCFRGTRRMAANHFLAEASAYANGQPVGCVDGDDDDRREPVAPADGSRWISTRIRRAVREILLAVGEDPDREGLRETPDRVARMYAEVFQGLHQDPRIHLRSSSRRNTTRWS